MEVSRKDCAVCTMMTSVNTDYWDLKTTIDSIRNKASEFQKVEELASKGIISNRFKKYMRNILIE